MNQILITSYHNADIDGVACAYAYSELLNSQGKSAIGKISGSPYIEARWVLSYLNIDLPEFGVDQNQKVILVDTSDPSMIPYEVNPNQVIEIVDHRKTNNADQFPHAKIQIELVGAAATLIAEKFIEAQITPSTNSAILLYAGIASNTLNFKAKVTTDRDIKIANWLKQLVEIPSDFIHNMFAAKSDFSKVSMKQAIGAELSKVFDVSGRKFAIGQLEMTGVNNLIENRFEEILQALSEIKSEMAAELGFLSCIDLEEGYNAFVYTNETEKMLIKKVLGAEDNGKVLKRSGVILRKEIMPLLVEHFNH